ncbi:MerR family transcriptional regulator [Lactobacillus sp. CBA3605]|uniref:MerR family transcriptional regulator n=1 Tax=Lactobacillus sp. CBA3605 TaxID=2099788 RepID=UPI000CFA862D|nr:MerR family transcriptional regulator [Lactobacillus sp. CBA3605]AVK62109.1 MerR family transcriptional regulator [Lactobacillus sp. CBA3605]
MDDQDEALIKRLKCQFNAHQFELGISDLSKGTGVSQTQLRYWEQKGYIYSKNVTEKNAAHHYSYGTFMRVHLIKAFLDEGFTLAAAAKMAAERRNRLDMMRLFTLKAFQGIEERDGHHMLNLGYFDEAKTQVLYGYMVNEEVHYQVYPRNK